MSTSKRGEPSGPADAFATRLMGSLFAIGSAGFVVGPLGVYAGPVGARGDALTFFVASILFTGGGLAQAWLAYPERRAHHAGSLAWRAAWIQSVGTILFNFMTLEALSHSASDAHYDVLVWMPNALGSACFLVSGGLLYLSAPRAGWRPLHRTAGWWEPPVNLLGCVLFAVSAVAGYAINASGQVLALTTANWTTSLGAACFLAVGLAAVVFGMTFKVPRLSRLIAFERALQRQLTDAERELAADARRSARGAERRLAEVEHTVEPEVDRVQRESEQALARSERLLEHRAEPP